MSKIYVQLGRTGDICAILPMLYALAQRGEKNKLMVASEYASILDGVSYVEPFIFNGAHHQLAEAIEQAKAHGDVVVTQVNGPREVVADVAQKQAGGHATDSFVKEMWRQAGQMDLWREAPPLVFDKRDIERERALVEKHFTKKRVILASLRGNSAPFEYGELCLELLRLKFSRYFQVLDLSGVITHRFYDLIGLFERAECLITSDSAPLHLAWAVPDMPVLALVNDKPSPWHGSAWKPNRLWTCRYSDFPKRALEMLTYRSVEETKGGWFSDNRRAPTIHHVWNCCENPKETKARLEAEMSWDQNCASDNHWAACPVHVGAVGRTADWTLKDPERHPFLKAAMQLPMMRAKGDDVIALTRSTTCFSSGLGDQLLEGPAFARRIFKGQYWPQTDLLSAPKPFWKEVLGECPDFVLGRDYCWSQVLAEIFKLHGARELIGATYVA